jgi:predicted RNA binding protein YcfA (HicA-like mRNA interferase family)
MSRRLPKGMPSHVRGVLLRACNDGWRVTVTHGGHLRLEHPEGGVVFASSTPSSRHAGHALQGDLRRARRTTTTKGDHE